MKDPHNYHRQFLAHYAKKTSSSAILYAGSSYFPPEVMTKLLANNDLFIHIERKDSLLSIEYLELSSRCPFYNIQKYLEFTKELMFDFDNSFIKWRFFCKSEMMDYTTIKLPSSSNILIF